MTDETPPPDAPLKEREPYVYTPKTDAQLEKLAQDLVAGHIFHAGMIERAQDASMVFMPLVFMERPLLDEMQKAGICFIYEYISEAGPRLVNGMPTFMSVQFLNDKDTKVLFEKAKEIDAFMRARRGEPPREEPSDAT